MSKLLLGYYSKFDNVIDIVDDAAFVPPIF